MKSEEKDVSSRIRQVEDLIGRAHEKLGTEVDNFEFVDEENGNEDEDVDDSKFLDIKMVGHSILRSVAEPVPVDAFGSDELKELAENMMYTMKKVGQGLSAPQVGLSLRILTVGSNTVDEIP